VSSRSRPASPQRLGRLAQVIGAEGAGPQSATLAMSSVAKACSPTNPTRSAETMAASSSWTCGSPCPVNAATAMAWNPGCGQDGGQHRRANGVATAGHLEGEFGGEGLDAGGAGALPLRPQQAQGHPVTTGIAAV
jgi:hypothetical protein